MKIVNQEEKKIKIKFPFEVECDCGTKLLIEDKNDLQIGELGLYYFKCPCCNESTYLDAGIDLDENNLEFPKHYTYFGNGVKITYEKIDKEVKRMIESLKSSKDEDDFYRSWGSGNTYIEVNKFTDDEEYRILVAKDYYETYIPI